MPRLGRAQRDGRWRTMLRGRRRPIVYRMPIPETAPPARHPPARTIALQQIQRWIEDGTLQPGEALRDTEVATKLGVSRTPVREAFQHLDALGLVVTTANSRTQVAPATPRDAASLYVPLAALHASAVELSIAVLQPEDFERLVEFNEIMLAAVRDDDPGRASQADESFHGVLLDRTGNQFLRRVADWLTVHARRLNTLYFSHHAPSESSYHEHAEIIEALRLGDTERVVCLTKQNMLRTVQVLGGTAL